MKSKGSVMTSWRNMTNSEIEAFKNDVRNLNFWKAKVAEFKGEEDMIYHILGGYKSPDPSKIPGSYNPNINMQKAKLSDKLADIERRKNSFQSRIDAVEEMLNKVPEETRQHIIDIYVNKKGYIKVAESIPIARTGLYQRINKALKRIPYVMPK